MERHQGSEACCICIDSSMYLEIETNNVVLCIGATRRPFCANRLILQRVSHRLQAVNEMARAAL